MIKRIKNQLSRKKKQKLKDRPSENTDKMEIRAAGGRGISCHSFEDRRLDSFR